VRILVVDNYDSFVFNLVQYLGQLGATCVVLRNDEVKQGDAAAFDGVLLSPGPGIPEDAGVCVPLIKEMAGRVPIFGVCLGHQAIGVAYGAVVNRAPELLHGKTSEVHHAGAGVLAGLRSDAIGRVRAGGLVISRGDDDLRWWTWAGYRVNATLKATLSNVADEAQRVDDLSIRLRADLRPSSWRGVIDPVRDRLCLPEVDEKALTGLKFSEALPRPLAVATLARRLADLDHARAVLVEPTRFER